MSHASKRVLLIAGSIAICLGLIAAAPFQSAQSGTVTPVTTLATDTPDVLVKLAPTLSATLSIVQPDGSKNFPVPRSRPWNIGSATTSDSSASEIDRELLEEMRGAIRPEPALPTPKPKSLYIPGTGPVIRGTLVVQTERLDIYVGKGSFTQEQVAALAPRLERLLMVNENGFWPTKLDHRVSIGFYSRASAPSRGTRGMAYTSENRIEVYFNADEDPAKAATIAAHELAHHLQHQRYGKEVHQRADRLLLEGQATWISGVRWLSEYNAESWRRRAKQINESGVPLILVGAESYGADNAYELWASFVSYLVKFYGIEHFDAVYASGRGRGVGSADYQGVYGKSLQDLADEWREYIQTIPPPTPEPTVTPEISPTTLPDDK